MNTSDTKYKQAQNSENQNFAFEAIEISLMPFKYFEADTGMSN